MTPSDPDIDERPDRAAAVDLPRLGVVVGTAGIVLTGLYWGAQFAADHGHSNSLFGYGFLFVVPFVAVLVLGALFRVYWMVGIDGKNLVTSAISIALLIVVLLSLLAAPLLLCLTIAAPLWLVGAIAGGFASRWLVKRSAKIQLLLIISLLASSAIILGLESRASYPVNRYVVARVIEIDASPEQVWPLLLELANLGTSEGRRTFSQNVLGVPRPVEAIVHGAGVGAVRTGRWQRDVWFEEHVTIWKPQEQLEWNFVFPEGSTFASVDQHIDPRGPNLVVETGGYRLAQLPGGSTRLELFTKYSASTAVNAYSSLWGELVLGDVQNNILTIVKQRAEDSKAEPDGSSSLIAAN